DQRVWVARLVAARQEGAERPGVRCRHFRGVEPLDGATRQGELDGCHVSSRSGGCGDVDSYVAGADRGGGRRGRLMSSGQVYDQRKSLSTRPLIQVRENTGFWASLRQLATVG